MPKTFRIETAQRPPVVYLFTDPAKAQRKVRTLARQGVKFSLFDNGTDEPITPEDLK